jgi:hypothetical protein
MPDIAMCANVNCGVRFKCTRYTVKEDPMYQSYIVVSDSIETTEDCDSFWDNRNERTVLEEIPEEELDALRAHTLKLMLNPKKE